MIRTGHQKIMPDRMRAGGIRADYFTSLDFRNRSTSERRKSVFRSSLWKRISRRLMSLSSVPFEMRRNSITSAFVMSSREPVPMRMILP